MTIRLAVAMCVVCAGLAGAPGASATSSSATVIAAGRAALRGSAAAVAAAPKPEASISAWYTVRANGKVRVQVTTDAKKVTISYRTSKNKKRSTTITVRKGVGTKTLAKGSRTINARTKATTLLGASTSLRAAAYPLATPTSALVSLGPDGRQADSYSESPPAVSTDGRYIAYASGATTLVADDTNRAADVFVRDVKTGTTTRVSLAPDGAQANGGSYPPAMSADGRYIAYASDATNLVSGDTNHATDVFRYDRETGITARVSVATGGTQADGASSRPSISADGRSIAYASDATNLVTSDTNHAADVFLHDQQTAVTSRVSVSSDGKQGDGGSWSSAVSGDGRFVTYESWASNLVTGDTNGAGDVFLLDRSSGVTTRVSVDSTGAQTDGARLPRISGDGRYVTFTSVAANLAPGDTNETWDVFLFDRQAATTIRVSVASSGTQANGSSGSPMISSDGRYVTYTSGASNLAPGDTNTTNDVFVFDRLSASTIRVPVGPSGAQAAASSDGPAISADGRYIAYNSWAPNVAKGDSNDKSDILVARMW